MVANGVQEHRWSVLLLAGGITLTAALLRFRGLGLDGLWFDEGATWLQVRDGVLPAIAATAADTYPPAYSILAALAVSTLGDSEWVLRFPAALAGTLTVPATLWLGLVAAGRRAGLMAASITAIAAFAIYYSTEARMYALLMLASALFVGATILAADRPTLARWIAVAVGGALLLYSRPYGALEWASVGAVGLVVMLVHRRGWRSCLGYAAAQVAGLVLFAPWLVVTIGVARRLVEEGFWIARPTPSSLLTAIVTINGGWLASLPIAAGSVLLFVSLVWRRMPDGDEGKGVVARRIAIPILLAALAPILVGYQISQWTTPIFHPRYLIGVVPAMIVLAAVGLSQFARTRRSLALIAGVTAICLAPAAAEQPLRSRFEDWRGLAVHLAATIHEDDCLYLGRRDIVPVLTYYLRNMPNCLVVGIEAASEPDALPPNRRVFAVLSHQRELTTDHLAQLPGAIDWGDQRKFGTWIDLLVRPTWR